MAVITESRVLSNNTLILRRFRESDLANLYSLTSSKEAMTFLGGVMNQEQTRDYLHRMILPKDSGAVMYAVIYRPTMEFAGLAGFLDSDSESPEIQVAILPPLQRKGLARSALSLCLDYANDVLCKSQISISIHPDNKVGKKVLRKVGFKFKKTLFKNGKSREYYTFSTLR